MIPYWKLFGRLGNSMFQGAFMYSYAKDNNTDYFFQDPKWFEKHEADIRALFGQSIPKQTDMVAMHVRRGDYVDNPFYVDLIHTEYYDKAMEMFPDAKFLIFSDDIDFCKRWFHGEQYEFFHGTELEDMNMMASCKGHIIANSSFSWWGAWLSPYTQLVVAPHKDKWYTDGEERTVCPNYWVRI